MQEKMDCMTSAELRAVMAELRPPDVCDLVERDHEVLAARQARDSLSEQLRQARMDVIKAERQMGSWRSAHPLRAKLHDFGLMSSRFLAERNEIKSAAEIEVLKLVPRVHDITEYVSNIENEVEARILLEQAPVRERMAELERLERRKAMRELTERWQTRELGNTHSVFKPGMKAYD
ncbi:hypothetical protein SAMN05216315_12330 [Nitrosospira sp. Nsp18]|nr:hypothetical protein SAMN05216315_12330 [Nitrosospira sp. Nsp18]